MSIANLFEINLDSVYAKNVTSFDSVRTNRVDTTDPQPLLIANEVATELRLGNDTNPIDVYINGSLYPGTGGNFVTLDTDQSITGQKAFIADVYFSDPANGVYLHVDTTGPALEINAPQYIYFGSALLDLDGPTRARQPIYFGGDPGGPAYTRLATGTVSGTNTISLPASTGTVAVITSEFTSTAAVMTLDSGSITSSLLRGVLQGTPGTMSGIRFVRVGSIVTCCIPSWEVNTDSGTPTVVTLMAAGSIPSQFRPTLFAAEVSAYVYNNGVITSPNAAIKVGTDGSMIYEYGGTFTTDYGMIDGDFTFSYMI